MALNKLISIAQMQSLFFQDYIKYTLNTLLFYCYIRYTGQVL